MIEIEIAEKLINEYIAFKEQGRKTIALGTNLRDKNFENCDFELLKKYLNKQGYQMYIEQQNNHNFLYITSNL